MQSILCIVSTLLIVTTSFVCHKENQATLTGKWRLVQYHNLITSASETEPAAIPRSIIIELSDEGHEGKISGHTVTNTIFGTYEILKPNKMKILSFGGTEIGEPAWGNKFWDAIPTTESYALDNKLFIFFNKGREKMEFTKQ